jgi:hypothetical protein
MVHYFDPLWSKVVDNIGNRVPCRVHPMCILKIQGGGEVE